MFKWPPISWLFSTPEVRTYVKKIHTLNFKTTVGNAQYPFDFFETFVGGSKFVPKQSCLVLLDDFGRRGLQYVAPRFYSKGD